MGRRGAGNEPVAVAHKSRGPAQRGSECTREGGYHISTALLMKTGQILGNGLGISARSVLLTESVPVHLEQDIPHQDRTPSPVLT